MTSYTGHFIVIFLLIRANTGCYIVSCKPITWKFYQLLTGIRTQFVSMMCYRNSFSCGITGITVISSSSSPPPPLLPPSFFFYKVPYTCIPQCMICCHTSTSHNNESECTQITLSALRRLNNIISCHLSTTTFQAHITISSDMEILHHYTSCM